MTKYSNMLRKVFSIVVVFHCLVASINAETSTKGIDVSSTSQRTPEIKERFFGLDQLFGSIFKGPGHNPGLGFGGNPLTAPYPIQQNPQQGNWQNIQTPQQSPNMGQDFSQQANFDQYPSQNQGNFNPGNGVRNFQNQNPMIQQGNWQNVQTPQQYPNQGQNFNQQYPSQNQGNFNSGNSQWPGQNQNAQPQEGDWRNVRTPQQFPSQQDFSQQYNSDQYPSQSQNSFGPGANQNFNTGTIDDIPTQRGIQQTGYPMQSQNTGQNGFQNQNLQGSGGNYNPAAILGKPVRVPPTSEPDRIVFQDDSDTPEQVQCVQDCQTTTEYHPICGSNNITYFNLGRIKCARNCGINVFPDRPGRCF